MTQNTSNVKKPHWRYFFYLQFKQCSSCLHTQTGGRRTSDHLCLWIQRLNILLKPVCIEVGIGSQIHFIDQHIIRRLEQKVFSLGKILIEFSFIIQY